MLEKLRLSAWKKNPVNAEKDKETKDGPKILESNVSSVTKGVKFAVSMFILFVIDYIMYLSLDQNSDPNFSNWIKIELNILNQCDSGQFGSNYGSIILIYDFRGLHSNS